MNNLPMCSTHNCVFKCMCVWQHCTLNGCAFLLTLNIQGLQHFTRSEDNVPMNVLDIESANWHSQTHTHETHANMPNGPIYELIYLFPTQQNAIAQHLRSNIENAFVDVKKRIYLRYETSSIHCFFFVSKDKRIWICSIWCYLREEEEEKHLNPANFVCTCECVFNSIEWRDSLNFWCEFICIEIKMKRANNAI